MTTSTLTAFLLLVYPALSLFVTGNFGGVNWGIYGSLSAVLIGFSLAVFSRSGYTNYILDSTPNFLTANTFLGFVSYCSLAWGSVVAFFLYLFTDGSTWKEYFPVCSNISYLFFAALFGFGTIAINRAPQRQDWR